MLKLDLGAGAVSPEGFTPLGRDHGSEVFPLRFPDASADAIRASHVLEHFSAAQVPSVLAEWVRVLKPGGTLKIAVPDFTQIAADYLDGSSDQAEAFVMGGQVDDNDFHKTIFNRDKLRHLFAGAGLVLLDSWKSELADCAALPVSLNICGRKPFRDQAKVAAVLTAPRLGFNDFWTCAVHSLPPLGIEFTKISGAFWDQCITKAIEQAVADPSLDYVLTTDYDSVFNKAHVARLIELALVYPEADAIAPLQGSRHNAMPLFGLHGPKGDVSVDVPREDMEVDLKSVRQAHFGLTLLKAEKLRNMPKPWFLGMPNDDGRWEDGKTDPDIYFWRQWEMIGNTLMLAPRVIIGHLELMVRWPDENMQPMWQTTRDWETTRKAPPGAWTGR